MMFVRATKTGLAPVMGLLALCAAAGAAQAQVGEYYPMNLGAPGQLATHPPYPYGRADDVRRPGFNGRLWIGRPVIGGVDTGYPYGWADPGPEAYGAAEDDASQAFVRIGSTAVALSPWEAVRGTGLKNLESGRQAWLAERGYTGGVRTFVNDLYLYAPAGTGEGERSASAEGKSPAGEIQPRATIHVPLDQPRFKARMQVRSNHASGAAAIALLGDGAPLNISWPQTAPAGDASLIKVVTRDTAVAGANSSSDNAPGTVSTNATPVQPAATPVASAER